MKLSIDMEQLLQGIGEWAFLVWNERETVQMYLHLMFAAILPIYAGAHASLKRPPSAAKPPKKTKKESRTTEDVTDDELEDENLIEGLRPSDAILFPVMAGLTLTGLYFLIKWLKDPKLLNIVLGYYFSAVGIFGIARLATDTINLATSMVFPTYWATKRGIYKISPVPKSIQGESNDRTTALKNSGTAIESVSNPLPGQLSVLCSSQGFATKVWTIRALIMERWIFRGYMHGLLHTRQRVRLSDAFGLAFGLVATFIYHQNDKPWYLGNLMGFAFCYGTLQLLSPTTFWTGSLLLAGLFIYDIVMVFYTPMMVTVATQLDVPIKLVLPGPKRGSMLGLGDIVLPGIMIGLALRFDLYLHYLRRKWASPTKELQPYKTPSSSLFGDLFWTRSNKSARPAHLADAAFKKTYFHASMFGYVVGMTITLIVMNVWKHAQPALFYLVPGVLGSLWGTAFVRGELGLMWRFTESGDDIVDVNGEAKPAIGQENKSQNENEQDNEDKGPKSRAAPVGKKHEQVVFRFSLSAPRHRVPDSLNTTDPGVEGVK
jgi:minor histocompatibility antigen H13